MTEVRSFMWPDTTTSRTLSRTRSRPRSLQSIAILNRTRSRIFSAISSRTRFSQTCLGLQRALLTDDPAFASGRSFDANDGKVNGWHGFSSIRPTPFIALITKHDTDRGRWPLPPAAKRQSPVHGTSAMGRLIDGKGCCTVTGSLQRRICPVLVEVFLGPSLGTRCWRTLPAAQRRSYHGGLGRWLGARN